MEVQHVKTTRLKEPVASHPSPKQNIHKSAKLIRWWLEWLINDLGNNKRIVDLSQRAGVFVFRWRSQGLASWSLADSSQIKGRPGV